MPGRLNNNFQFIDVGRKDPERFRFPVVRKSSRNLYTPFKEDEAKHQAHRCLECGNPCGVEVSGS